MADSRDWDKEMAAIDKVIAKGGYVAPQGGAPAPQGGGGASAPAPSFAPSGGVAAGSRAWFGIWIRTLLALALAFGLWVWPWTRFCGLNLYAYLGAIVVLGLASLWVMIVGWKGRSAFAHILGFLMFGLAVWLGAAEILPRVEYAKLHRVWACPVQPPPAGTVTQ
jgi:hypothetical protein